MAFKKTFVPSESSTINVTEFTHHTHPRPLLHKTVRNRIIPESTFPLLLRNTTTYTTQPSAEDPGLCFVHDCVHELQVCRIFFSSLCSYALDERRLEVFRHSGHSVLDESVNVILCSVVACGHLKHERNAKQSLLCVSVCDNLRGRKTHQGEE